MRTTPPVRRVVILGVAASDCHVVANRLIAMSLVEAGFDVVNLGACTSVEAFAEAFAARPEAECVLIGSVNGHAYDDLADLPAVRRRGGLACPVVLGGRLGVGRDLAEDYVTRLHDLGVDVVCTDAADLLDVLDRLRPVRDEARAG